MYRSIRLSRLVNIVVLLSLKLIIFKEVFVDFFSAAFMRKISCSCISGGAPQSRQKAEGFRLIGSRRGRSWDIFTRDVFEFEIFVASLKTCRPGR